MKITDSKIRSLRRQGVTILILLLVLGTYFAIVVPAQRKFLAERNFRLLAAMTEQISEVLGNLTSSLWNATRPPQPASSVDTNGSPFLSVIRQASQRGETNQPPTLDRIESRLRLVPNLVLAEKTTNAPLGPNATAVMGFRVVPAGTASRLELEFQGGANSGLRLRAHSEISRLLDPIVRRAEFDDVLVLATNGDVIFQRASSDLRVTHLSIPHHISFQTNLVRQGGAEYRLFAQPLQFAAPAPAPEGAPALLEWTVCGLVKADRFNRQTRAVSYTLLVVALFLAALLILSWPFLNIWSLGVKGGLRVGEVFLLVLSTISMSAFLTLLVLDLFGYERMKRTLDGQLAGLADRILDHFGTEIRQAARQLNLLNTRFLESGETVIAANVLSRPELVDLSAPAVDPYPYFQMAFWSDLTGNQRAKWTVKNQATPLVDVAKRDYFRRLADGRPWTLNLDGDSIPFALEPIFSVNTGENLVVLTRFPTNDSRVVAAIDLRLLSLLGPILPPGYGFCVIDSSGRVLFHSDETRNLRENFFEECNQEHRLLAAVLGRQTERFDAKYAGQLCSLHVTPVPHFPWSLVAFRKEIVGSTVQLEMVSVSLLLFLGYVSLYVALFGLAFVLGPQRHLRWLWPSENRRNTYALLFVVHLILGGVFTAIIYATREPVWKLLFAFVIPALALGLSYRALGRGTVGSARLRLAARRVGRFRLPHPIGYVTVMSLLQILLGMLPMLAFFKIAFHHENTLMVKAAQIQLARDLQARAQDLWTRIGGAEPPSDAKAAALAVPDRQAFYERRLTNSWDACYRFFYDTRVDWNIRAAVNPFANRPGRGDLIDAGLAFLRPHYNEQDVLTRSVANPAAADGAWWWTNGAGGGISTDRFESSAVTNHVRRLVYTKTGFHLPPDGTAHTLSIDSAEPRWPGFSFVWFWPFLLLFCLPLLITFIIADKVLLLRIRPPDREATSMIGPDPHPSGTPFGPGRYLLLGPARSGKSLLLRADRFASLEPGKFHRVDLRRADDQKWLEPEREDELLAATDRAIVVDHLDHDLDAPAFNHKKLRFLERLLRDEKRSVVLVSNVHPLHFAMGASSAGKGESEQGTPPPSTSDVNAWVDVLAAFKSLYCHRRCTDASSADPEGPILPEARALYRSVWMTCSPVEQEILHQVAQRRLISSYLPELPSLLDRGLLRRDPALTLFSQGFRHFVLSAYRPGAPIPGVPSGATNLWQSLKGPAVTVLIILAGFLVATQQDLWQNTVAWGTAFVGGIGVFAKVFEVLQQARLKREAER